MLKNTKVKYYLGESGCESCPNRLFLSLDVKIDSLLFSDYDPAKGGSFKDYQAEGAHLYRNGENADDGYWIIPLCKKCNHPTNNSQMDCKYEVTVCEELAATEE